MKAPPVELNLQQAALLLDVSAPTVKALIEQGLPCLERGGHGHPWRFDMADVAAWDRESGPNAQREDGDDRLQPELEKARKDRAQAELAELELAKRRGRMVDVDDVEKIIVDDYSRVRARLLSMPSKLAPMLATMSAPAEVEAVIVAEVSEALGELAAGSDIADESERPEIADSGAQESAESAASAASPARKRVGRPRAAPLA